MSQVRVELWNRNGREIFAEMQTYESIFFQSWFRDLDILTLQIGAILMGAASFFKFALKKYELHNWYPFFLNKKKKSLNLKIFCKKITTTPHRFENPTVDANLFDEKQKKMIEEFLKFIAYVSTERTKTGLNEESTIRFRKYFYLKNFLFEIFFI